MTENEAIEMLNGIQVDTRNLKHALKCADMIEIAVKALEEVKQYRKIGAVEECREAIEKQKEKKVILEPWCPAICPKCREELSESIGDGYYKHWSHLKICPKCGQKIKWSDEE